MLQVTLVLYNLRSAHNVGSILRTADAVGVHHVVAVGTTPYPEIADDPRPPHVRLSNTKAIAKVALGAHKTMSLSYSAHIKESLSAMHRAGVTILALEQSPKAMSLFAYVPETERPLALIVGPEVEGVDQEILDLCDTVLEIPMRGHKESLNVAVATGIALYSLLK